jgi:hypothetical protein
MKEGKSVAIPLPQDVKSRAEEKCKEGYPYLTVQDPGTIWQVDGRILVYVLDQNKRGLWLEV